jgi:uncharacterized protein (DUF302 family)
MKRTLVGTVLACLALPVAAAGGGLVTRPSLYPVDDTVARVERVAASRGLTTFARIDHAAQAAGVGMSLRPIQLVIFGSPKGGTPMMQATPTIGIDLPLKVLAWQDAEGRVWVTYNAPDYVANRHGLPQDLGKPLAGVAGIVDEALR